VYATRLEQDLDAAYDKYLSETKNAEAKSGTRHAKRTKKAKVALAAEAEMEDTLMFDGDQVQH
jgi:hypothetical protein